MGDGLSGSSKMRYHHSYCCLTYSIRWNKYAILMVSTQVLASIVCTYSCSTYRQSSCTIIVMFALVERVDVVARRRPFVFDMVLHSIAFV